MKKLLILFCLIISMLSVGCTNLTFNKSSSDFIQQSKNLGYKPIPKHLSKQYKKEMEQIIDNEYPQVIKNIEDYVNEATIYYNDILKNGYNSEYHINITNIAEVILPSAELGLYADLMKVTQEKYLGIKYDPVGTDSTAPLDEYLYPYFKDNNVNSENLTKIAKYENKNIGLLEEYLKNIQKFMPNQ